MEVWFTNADPNRAVYGALASEIAGQLPEEYDKKPTTHVLFESPVKGAYIKYDELLGKLETLLQAICKFHVKIGEKGEINLEVGNLGKINIKASGGKVNIEGDVQVTIDGSLISMGESSEAFIKGTSALREFTKDQVALEKLQAALTAWVPVPLDGGAALKNALVAFLDLPMADYSGILSTKIFGE